MRKKKILGTAILLFSLVLMVCGGERHTEIPQESSLEESDEEEQNVDVKEEPEEEARILAENLGYLASEEEKCVWFSEGEGGYLYIQKDQDNGYFFIEVYRYEKGRLSFIGERDGAFAFLMTDPDGTYREIFPDEPESFLIEDTDFKLGTLYVTAEYRVGGDGMPEKIGKYLYYTYDGRHPITADMDMPATLVDEEGESIANTELSEGVTVIPYRTDDESFIDVFVEENGGANHENILRIPIEWDEKACAWLHAGAWMLPEQKLTELFTGLDFAG